jgi:hypothetical protein
MLQSKIYVKRVIFILMAIFSIAYLYVYIYSYYYPLPILSRISLDAKLKFIRENIDTEKVDTIIVGSSIGLNNIHGSTLEKSSIKCESVLNLSGFELRPGQIEQLLKLTPVFPNLKRVIYSAQFSDFSQFEVFTNYDIELLKRYILKKETISDVISILSHSFSNIITCINRQFNWDSKHQASNNFSYLGFDSTGSVPLHIYGADIIKFRWETPHGAEQDLENDIALNRMVKRVEEKGVDFYFILQPNREELVKKFRHVKDSLNYFEQRVQKIMKKQNGSFLNLHRLLQLPDKYFADRTHLNDKGCILTTRAIADFIDRNK